MTHCPTEAFIPKLVEVMVMTPPALTDCQGMAKASGETAGCVTTDSGILSMRSVDGDCSGCFCSLGRSAIGVLSLVLADQAGPANNAKSKLKTTVLLSMVSLLSITEGN